MPETFRRKAIFQAMRWNPEDPQEFYDWMVECGHSYRLIGDLSCIEVSLPRGLYRTLGPGRWFMRTAGNSGILASDEEMADWYERVDPNSVTLTRERYEELNQAEWKLCALESGGVDNWSGYWDSLEDARKLAEEDV